MRSDLVRRARGPIPNRFLLALVAIKVTAKFGVHRDLRIQERINNTLLAVAQGRYYIWPDRVISGLTQEEMNDAAK